jgi:hypothetical protein
MNRDIANEELIGKIQQEVGISREDARRLLAEIQPPIELKPELPENFWSWHDWMAVVCLMGSILAAVSGWFLVGCGE